MPTNHIYFADLTHTAQGISASTFPLGVSFVLSYAKSQLETSYEFSLFKFPRDLESAIRQQSPVIIALSNYSWNFELAYRIAQLAKRNDPTLITVFGGPNFPTLSEDKTIFLEERPAIDFYVGLEGEIGFVDLVRHLEQHGMDAESLKASATPVLNTAYLSHGKLISGPWIVSRRLTRSLRRTSRAFLTRSSASLWCR